MFSRITTLALACVIAALFCCAARAQQTASVVSPVAASAPPISAVSITPASVDAKVKRGTTYTQTYTVSNNTPTRLRLRCSLIDYWYDGQNRRLTGRPGTLPRSASPWVQLSPSEVVLEPNGSANVKAVISVPLSAEGGYYTMPVFEAMPEAATVNVLTAGVGGMTDGVGGMTAAASIGVRFRGLVMLTTEDASEYNVEIMGGGVTPPSNSSALGIDLDVRNRSTTHARVRGVFAILDASGRLAGRGKVSEKRFMPGQRDSCRAEWAGGLAAGRYTAIVTLSYDRAGAEPATLVYEIPFDVSARQSANSQ